MSSENCLLNLVFPPYKFERRNITNSESSLVVGQFLHSHLSKQTLLLIMKIQIVCPVGMMRGSGRFVLMQPLGFQNAGKPVSTKSGNRPMDIAVKRRGELVCTDTRDKSINIVADTKIQPTIR